MIECEVSHPQIARLKRVPRETWKKARCRWQYCAASNSACVRCLFNNIREFPHHLVHCVPLYCRSVQSDIWQNRWYKKTIVCHHVSITFRPWSLTNIPFLEGKELESCGALLKRIFNDPMIARSLEETGLGDDQEMLTSFC